MVRDLLRGFMPGAWVRELDLGTLERASGSDVSDDLRDRADDIIWRVRWGQDWLYVYRLLEFQSSVDSWMAVRIQTYLGLLYQDLIRAQQLSVAGRLPPVLPVVLYNGANAWTAAETLEPLIEPAPSVLEAYRPRQGYLRPRSLYRPVALEPCVVRASSPAFVRPRWPDYAPAGPYGRIDDQGPIFCSTSRR